ncbi:MAG: zinc ribbon domain-containing protein [Micrococcales bacterium]|nr:zinc ribbon domain-containing protein [Micrococcales bacterium]
MTSNDPFGGLGSLGGILGGIARSVVPQDTPEGKLLAAQGDLAHLRKQENELLLEIGREAYRRDPSAWPQDARLQLVQQNIATAEHAAGEARAAQEAAEAAKAAQEAAGRCPGCGNKNPDGVRFCQECGTNLAAAGPKHCTSCSAELAPDARFCGGCGTRQE